MAKTTLEIITGRERRRRWSVEDKLRVSSATYEPGACLGFDHPTGEIVTLLGKRALQATPAASANVPATLPTTGLLT
jgi:hypothetical protein